MKLKGRLPKDDANGIEAFETELTGNLRNGQTVLALVLLGTEDVLARKGEPIVTIVDIEGVPDVQRSHLLEVMSAIKSERMGQITGQTSLDLPEPAPLDLDDEDAG